MILDLDKILAATLPEALNMALEPELSDPAFWLAAGIIGAGMDPTMRNALHAAAYAWDRPGAEQVLRELRAKLPKMTIEQLAGCIAVVKNFMFAERLNKDEAGIVLWDLANEVTDSAHYVPGTSRVIDKLLMGVK